MPPTHSGPRPDEHTFSTHSDSLIERITFKLHHAAQVLLGPPCDGLVDGYETKKLV